MRVLAALVAAAAGFAAAQGDLDRLLRIDAGDMRAQMRRVTAGDGWVLDDLRGTGPEVATLEAYVVRPAVRPDSCAGILFIHWFAPPDPTSNRTQFLDEAKTWARRGVVSVLPSTFWSAEDEYRRRRWQTDFQNSVEQARQLRRALRILRSQPCVDPARIAIVGHDYGAMFGSLVAAVEPDVRATVLIAGVPKFSHWYEFGSSTGVPTGDDRVAYRAELARIDPGLAVSLYKGPTLFQFGTNDKYTPKDQYEAFFAASAGAKEMKTYDSGHDMRLPQIADDRTAWLEKQLGVK